MSEEQLSSAPVEETPKPVRKRRKSQHYVNNGDLFVAIEKFNNDTTKEIPPYIAECVYLIATNLSKKPNFINYPYVDDMIGEAVYDCMKAVQAKNFKVEKSKNPFAFFTTVCYNAFIRIINKENKQEKLLYEFIQNSDASSYEISEILAQNTRFEHHAQMEREFNKSKEAANLEADESSEEDPVSENVDVPEEILSGMDEFLVSDEDDEEEKT